MLTTEQRASVVRVINDIIRRINRVEQILQGQTIPAAKIDLTGLDLYYLAQSENLADLEDIGEAQTNLGVYSTSATDALLALKLTKAGDTMTGYVGYPILTTSAASLTLGDTHHTVLCNTSSNDQTINLPSASTCTGRVYFIKCINATHAVTIEPSGSQTIDGSLNIVLRVIYDFAIIQSDGANWHLFSEAPQSVS